MTDAEERRRFWEPLLARGEPAVHFVKYFLHGYLTAGARQPSPAFVEGWREIVAWARETPGWSFSPKPPSHEMRQAWWSLLGTEGVVAGAVGAAPPSLNTGLKAHYDYWAGHDLVRSDSTQRLLNFLRLPSAVELLPDALRWLDRGVDVPTEQRWGFREIAPELSHFLHWVWTNHEKRVRAQPEAFAAFHRLLLRLGAEQDQVALALLSGLTASA